MGRGTQGDIISFEVWDNGQYQTSIGVNPGLDLNLGFITGFDIEVEIDKAVGGFSGGASVAVDGLIGTIEGAIGLWGGYISVDVGVGGIFGAIVGYETVSGVRATLGYSLIEGSLADIQRVSEHKVSFGVVEFTISTTDSDGKRWEGEDFGRPPFTGYDFDSVPGARVPIGEYSSSRYPGQKGSVPVGYEANALDVMSDARVPIGSYESDKERDWGWTDTGLGPSAGAPGRPGAFGGDPTVSYSVDRAPAGAQPGFSVPSFTPFASKGVNDLEGPEAVLDVTRNSDDRDRDGVAGGPSAGASGGTESAGGWSPSGGGSGDGGSSYGQDGAGNVSSSGPPSYDYDRLGPQPILLDLDGRGIGITELSRSTYFTDATNDGLKNQTAWAAAGTGVLFYDPDGTGELTEKRQYVFTEWDPTATSDIEALRAVFDSNGDGVFDASDAEWGNFRVLETMPDGSLVAQTLGDLGISAIDLTADATNIELPDGSVITGRTSFTRFDGTTGTVADTTLVAETEDFSGIISITVSWFCRHWRLHGCSCPVLC